MHFFVYYLLPFILVLGILIFFHELGHFMVAKLFGVKVLKFSLGFGPKVVGRRWGETQYLLSAIPLGGYVKMLGENDDEEDPPLSDSEARRAFSPQHVLKRIAIVAAGPLFNLLLAVFIFAAFYAAAGIQVMTPEVGQVRPGSPAERAGFLKGDRIVAIGDRSVSTWPEIKQAVQGRAGEELRIVVARGPERITLSVIPEASTVKNIFGETTQAALIGVVAAGKFERVDLSPPAAVREAFRKTGEMIKLTFLTVLKLVQRVIPIKTVGGPIFIGQMAGQLAQESLTYLIPFMAVISVNLAILNLLPVPILDGGVIFFLIIELLTGKPLSIRKREMAQKVGLFLLMTLMAVVIYNDVLRLLE